MGAVVGFDVGVFTLSGRYEVFGTMTSREQATETFLQWGESHDCNVTVFQETEPSGSKHGKRRNVEPS
jgi:hypothetical protein